MRDPEGERERERKKHTNKQTNNAKTGDADKQTERQCKQDTTE